MERLGRKSAKEPPLTHYGVSKLNFDFTLDITRAQGELGYQPVLTLDETHGGGFMSAGFAYLPAVERGSLRVLR